MTERRTKPYFKVFREAEHSTMWEDSDLWKLWSLCLFAARWAEKPVFVPKGNCLVRVNQGQFITGRDELYDRFYPIRHGRRIGTKKSRVCKSTLWKRLLLLGKRGFLNIDSNSRGTVVTVVNWRLYQRLGGIRPPNLTALLTTGYQQANTEEEREERKEYSSAVDSTVRVDASALTCNGAGAAVFSEDESTTEPATEGDMDGQGTLPGMKDVRFAPQLEQAGLALFAPLPPNWESWLTDMRALGHDDATITRTLNRARDESQRRGEPVKSLNYVSRMLAVVHGQGEPKEESQPAMPWTSAERLAALIDYEVYEIYRSWSALAARDDLWTPLCKPLEKRAFINRMYRDCSGAPSAEALKDAWRAFSKEEHNNPPTWSKFATVLKTQLGWEPIEPEKEAK